MGLLLGSWVPGSLGFSGMAWQDRAGKLHQLGGLQSQPLEHRCLPDTLGFLDLAQEPRPRLCLPQTGQAGSLGRVRSLRGTVACCRGTPSAWQADALAPRPKCLMQHRAQLQLECHIDRMASPALDLLRRGGGCHLGLPQSPATPTLDEQGRPEQRKSWGAVAESCVVPWRLLAARALSVGDWLASCSWPD